MSEILIRIENSEMKVTEAASGDKFEKDREAYWQHAKSRPFVDSPAEPVADVYLRIERGNVAYTEYQPYFLLDEPIEVEEANAPVRDSKLGSAPACIDLWLLGGSYYKSRNEDKQ